MLIHSKDHQLKKAKSGEIKPDEAHEQHCFVLIHYAAILLREPNEGHTRAAVVGMSADSMKTTMISGTLQLSLRYV